MEIRAHFGLPARVPMWIGRVFLCVLAVSGISAMVRSVPYADIPYERRPPQQESGPSDTKDAHAGGSRAQLAAEGDKINRRDGSRCRDCGIVESIRQIERPRDLGTRDTADAIIARHVSSNLSGDVGAAGAIAEENYEIKVRFRDGTTTIFNEANPQTWRLGTKVIVIGRRSASND